MRADLRAIISPLSLPRCHARLLFVLAGWVWFWVQVTACGDVLEYPETFGEFQLFVFDDANLQHALNGEPFVNCSCGDIQGVLAPSGMRVLLLLLLW